MIKSDCDFCQLGTAMVDVLFRTWTTRRLAERGERVYALQHS